MNIGLLMTYNEADIIEEMMDHNRDSVDAIFVLDGSDDGTAEILATYPEVKGIFKDSEVAPNERVRDYHRQVLLDAAVKAYGHDNWFTLMHGDEFFHNDPREIIERAERQGAKRVNWAAMQFFLHPSDEPVDPSLSVQRRLRWYSPFWVEIRQFKGAKTMHYQVGKHGKVIPEGIGWQPYFKMPILKHYPYRSPEQMKERLTAMKDRGFSGTSADVTIYRERYSPDYKQAREFKGDFAELELEHQGNLLTMLWRWKRLVKR